MLAKTHLAITLFFVLLFLNYVSHPVSFVLCSILATFLPDIDSKFSKLGKNKGFRIIQLFLKHRGILHSLFFLILITFFLVLFFPVISFPFFLGYGLHLFADSFTISGIRLFYPFRLKYSGFIETGTRKEIFIFVIFLFLNVFLASIIFNQWVF